LSPFCGVVNLDGAPAEADMLRAMMRPLAENERSEAELFMEGSFGAIKLRSSGSFGRAHGSGPVAVVCDSRIDDRDRLKTQLLSASTGPQPTDGDLLGGAYVRWGRGWHEHLKGAVAAALWDGDRKTLLLLRDRSGERGLYWSRTPRRLLFASEPILVAAFGEVDRKPNRLRLLAYLIGGRTDPTWSYFEGIHRIPEGCQLLSGPGGEDLDRYWTWDRIRTVPLDRQEATKELATRLRDAVLRRLPSEGETAVLLSGGLDSCSIAAWAADLLRQRRCGLSTYTWRSRTGDGIDETPWSRWLIASRSNVNEHSVEADDLWPLSRFPQAFSDPNNPETNTYPDLLLTTLEAARASGVSMLMTGIGGDSVIGWQIPELTLLAQGRFGALVRRWQAAGFRPRQVRLLRELRLTTGRLRLPGWLTPAGRELARDAGLDRPLLGPKVFLSLRRLRMELITSSSQAATLERYARLSDRIGLRIEAPWCDFDLASLVLSLPGCAFAEAPPLKGILRDAMASHLPDEIRNAETTKRERSNLRTRGLLQHGSALVESLLSGQGLQDLGIVDAGPLVNEYRKDRSAGRLTIPRLWEVLTAEAWYRAQQGF
jgi:asparagine synthetase B (glutamine-hydrolysing)